MLPRLLKVWQNISSSLWALPFAMVLGAIALAYFGITTKIGRGSDTIWFLYSGDAAAAPQFLSNLLTSMITMATLAISITMVVLTLAAQQLGPRLIRSFMNDRKTQIALGLFVGTVVYLLLILRTTSSATDSIPNLAVTGGTALVFLSTITLLIFVHHLANSIISDNAISRVGAALDDNVRRLLPTRENARPDPAGYTLDRGAARVVSVDKGGYVQAIDYDEMVSGAEENVTKIELALRPGHFVVPGTPIAWIDHGDGKDDLARKIASAVIIGKDLTELQDLEYSLRHLVEIALRAMSSGINDPYTAIAVLDRLTLSLAKVMKREMPAATWCDGKGTARVCGPRSTFEGLIEASFDQIRQQGSANPAILIHMIDALGILLGLADRKQRPILLRYILLVAAAGRTNIPHEHDRIVFETRVQSALGAEKHAEKKARCDEPRGKAPGVDVTSSANSG